MNHKRNHKFSQIKNQYNNVNKIRPASSCGNLSAIPKSRQNSPTRSIFGHNLNSKHDRESMIDAPIPVTHRRMYSSRYHATQPPWAIDDSLNPFDRNDNWQMKKMNKNKQINQSIPSMNHAVQTSTSFNEEENDEHYNDDIYLKPDKNIYPRDDSVHRSEVKAVIDPKYNKKPIKELKRESNRLRSPQDYDDTDYSGGLKSMSTSGDLQARIDYWLNRNNDTDEHSVNHELNPYKYNSRPSSNYSLPTTNKNKKYSTLNGPVYDSSIINSIPTYRNQISFTPRTPYAKASQSKQWTRPTVSERAVSPEPINAVFLDSSSSSEHHELSENDDYDGYNHIGGANYQGYYQNQNKFPVNSGQGHQFTIQARLSPKPAYNGHHSKSSTSSNHQSATAYNCLSCHVKLNPTDQLQMAGVRYHRTCFKCYWCKTNLKPDTYKVNGDKLCCPLHNRVM